MILSSNIAVDDFFRLWPLERGENLNQGMLLAITAYFLWGISPLYWKLHQTVPVDQVLAHRCIWTFVFMVLIMVFRHDGRWLRNALSNPKRLIYPAIAATLLGINWYAYTWAVTNNQVVEASLGYFINPLVSLFLGMVFLKEHLRRAQKASFVLAGVGVGVITYSVGSLPWVSIILALTFGVYGLIKKKVVFQPAQGMSVETGLFLIPAIAYLAFGTQIPSQTVFPVNVAGFDLINVTTGLATGIPLVLFAGAAQRLKLISIGIFQYIAPTLQFLLGVFLYSETFTSLKLVGFVLIWLGLAIFTVESLIRNR